MVQPDEQSEAKGERRGNQVSQVVYLLAPEHHGAEVTSMNQPPMPGEHSAGYLLIEDGLAFCVGLGDVGIFGAEYGLMRGPANGEFSLCGYSKSPLPVRNAANLSQQLTILSDRKGARWPVPHLDHAGTLRKSLVAVTLGSVGREVGNRKASA